jgi:hypothetical protein
MTNELRLQSASEVKPQTSSAQAEGEHQEQAEVLAENVPVAKHETTISRRAGLSKRAIMEELSRERFPWDE